MCALIQLLHEWFSAIYQLRTVVDIVLIDFAKAFDHHIVVKKIQNNGSTIDHYAVDICLLCDRRK